MTPGGFKDSDYLLVFHARKLLDEVRDIVTFFQPVKKSLNSDPRA